MYYLTNLRGLMALPFGFRIEGSANSLGQMWCYRLNQIFSFLESYHCRPQRPFLCFDVPMKKSLWSIAMADETLILHHVLLLDLGERSSAFRAGPINQAPRHIGRPSVRSISMDETGRASSCKMEPISPRFAT